MEPVGRAGWQKHPVDGVDEAHEARRHVAHVDDPVVGEHGGMPARVGEERRVGLQHLEGRLLLDRPPQGVLEPGAQLLWQVLVQHHPRVDRHPGRLSGAVHGRKKR